MRWLTQALLLITALTCVIDRIQCQITPVSSSTVYSATYGPAPAKISFTPASPALALSDDSVDAGVPIGFSFVFYNVSYTAVNLAPNGNIQFQTTASYYSPSTFGLGDPRMTPFIAFFYTDLYPTAVGQRTYATIGTAPNRQFILRYTNVGYCCSVIPYQGLSADVLLYEGSNNIEIRYYNFYVDTYHYADIGIENAPIGGTYDSISVLSDVIFNSTYASLLNNTAYVFSPITPFVNAPTYSVVSIHDGNSMVYTGTVRAAPALESFTSAGSLPSVDNTVVPINIGFDFPFYNWTYSTTYVSDNGNLQFQTGGSTAYPYTWGVSDADLAPFIAFYFADLLSTSGSRTYATVGVAPNRYFILRLSNIPYQTWIGSSNETNSIDVLLFENGNIEFRYYGVGAMSSTYYYCNIGIQNVIRDDLFYDYLSVFNSVNVGAFTAGQLVGKSILITPRAPLNNLPRYTGPPAPVPVNTASTIYTGFPATSAPAQETFSARDSLPNVDSSVTRVTLGFNFTFYNISYTSAYISSKGTIQFQTADNSAYPYTFGPSDSSLTPFIAFYWSDLLVTSATRTYATMGQTPNRYFILRIADCPLNTWTGTGNLTMDVLLYENSSIAFRYYQVPALNDYYYVNIGIQNVVSGNTYDNVAIVNYVNLNAMRAQPLVGLSYMISPRVPFVNPQPFGFTIQPQSSSTIYTATVTQGVVPPVMFTPSTSPALPQTDNDVTQVPIGFTFVFYNVAYTKLYVGANGDVQFQTANAYAYPRTFGSGTAQLAPLIAFFYADLNPGDSASVRTYGVTGDAPNRQFVLRYTNVALQSWITTDRVSVDLVLFETSNRIEIRYYNVPVFSSSYYYCAVGIENVANSTGEYDWIAIVNSKTVSPIISMSLNSSTYSFTPIVPFTNPQTFAPIRPGIVTSAVSTYTVTSRTTVPDMVTFTPASPPLPLDDNAATHVLIGFNFTFYGYQYDKLFIASNGNLQFRSASTTAYPSTFASTGAQTLWPYIAYYFADLAPTNVSLITYGTIGSAPNRQFIVRYNNVPFSYAGTMAAVNGDVILYETSNNVEFRYYWVSPTPYTYDYVSIGMANAVGDYVAIVNSLSLDGARALGLTGTSYLISPTTPFVNPPYWETLPLRVISNSVSYTGAVLANNGPRLLLSETALTIADDAVTEVDLGFNFVFYNVTYNRVKLSTNGNIQFSTSSTTWSPGLFGSGVSTLVPFIAGFFTDLWPGVANMTTYGRIGSAPNRQFVYRFNDVWFCCSHMVGRGLQADIVLFETTNVIEIRYYNIPVDGYHLVDIGIENSAINGVYDYLYVFNDAVMDIFSQEKLTGSTIRFTPMVANSSTPAVNPANAPQPVSFSTVYNATVSVAPAKITLDSPTTVPTSDDTVTTGIPIGFTFNFYNISYTALNLAPNGNIQFQTSSSSYIPGLFGAGDSSLSPFIAFFYSDLYPMTAGDRVYATMGSAPNRQFVVRITDVSYCCTNVANEGLSADIILHETSNKVEIRFYSVLQSGTRNVVVGIENVVTTGIYDYIGVINDVPISATTANSMQGISYTFTPLVQFTGGPLRYDINPIYMSTNYQVTFSDAPAPITLTSTTNLTQADDGFDTVQLGFNFVFYNRTYQSLGVSTNGNIQFETQSTTWSPSAFGSGSSSLVPFIAFFFSDMYPTRPLQRVWSVIGTAPNRQFVLRLTDVWYCCSYYEGSGLTMDVILSETSNTIDMRFYHIAVDNGHLVDIGIEAATSGYTEWVAIWNDRMFDSNYAATLTGKNVRFAPTYNTPVPQSSSSTGAAAVSSSAARTSSPAMSSSAAPATSSPVVPSSTAVPVPSSSAAQATSSPAVASSTGSNTPSSSSPAIGVPSSSSAPVSPTSAPVASSSSTGGGNVDNSSSSSSGLTGGQIAGVVIGVIVGVIILLVLLFCLLFRNTGEKFTPHTDVPESEASQVTGDQEAREVGEVEMETV